LSSQKSVIPLSPSQLDQAAGLLTRAFFDDPFFTYVIPDTSRRAVIIPRLNRNLIRYGLLYRQVFTTPDLEGIVLWLGPQHPNLSLLGILLSGMILLPLRLSRQELARSTSLSTLTDRLHQRSVTGQHWYLSELGVEPSLQGRGIGRALLQPVLAQADRVGQVCYLDTYNRKNLTFYAHLGFELVGSEQAGPSAPTVWGMRREPGADHNTLARNGR
jgi:ribosomal protein S18 acetylase RimI-like enzyme